jgi:predicted DNA-binding transcriptional regulator YafY
MSDSARLYAYKALFETKRLVTRADMMEVAEVSLATFKRDMAKLRDQLGMPCCSIRIVAAITWIVAT